MRVAYLVHDLNDPAVSRRIALLQRGGATVRLAGFRRHGQRRSAPPGVGVHDLGVTEDARLVRRAASVARTLLQRSVAAVTADADVVLARNLEMLALARSAVRPSQPLIYECLDIHRLMLSSSAVGGALRFLERRLLHRVDLVLVSSSAFIARYFEARQGWRGPASLVENKVVDPLPQPPPAAAGPPWRIGWFGMLRCRGSFERLRALAARLPGQVEIVVAGRPSPDQVGDLASEIEAAPGMRYLGLYSPADLPRLYGQVHYTWAVDFFEAGLNSDWLLPNRLYEGQLYGAPALAQAGVETGRWLRRHGVGVVFEDLDAELRPFFETLTADQHEAHRRGLERLPRSTLTADDADARTLLDSFQRRRTPR